MKKRILIISGPSGTGKSTLITELVKQREEFRLVKSVTDRKPRYDGEPYTFLYLLKNLKECSLRGS